VDETRLAGLDSSRLEVVARAYDSQKIHLLIRYLQMLREKLHA
jgi:hypothetical protein